MKEIQEIINKTFRSDGQQLATVEDVQGLFVRAYDEDRQALRVVIDPDSTIYTLLNEVRGKYVVAVYFSTVTSPDVSATITLPVAGTLITGGFAGGADVLVNQISGGVPIDETALDDGGNPIIGALAGNTVNLTVVSGTYTGSVAIVYAYVVTWSDYDRAYDLNPSPVFAGLSPGDVRATPDQTVVTYNDDGTITLSLADAVNLFLASKAQASGLASLDASSKVVQDPASASVTPGESKIPIAGAGGLIDEGWLPAATESAVGAVAFATGTEATAGTATGLAVTPAGLAAAQAIARGPLAFSQGLKTTYAASGSSGIGVLNQSNINFGTADFCLVWFGSIDTWAPSINSYFFRKDPGSVTSYSLYVEAPTGLLAFWSRTASLGTKRSTIAVGRSNNEFAMVTCSITRETVSTAGSVDFFINKFPLGSSVEVSASSPGTIDNSENLYISGLSPAIGHRFSTITCGAIMFNRALSSSDVIDLYNNGIAYADKWGSQTVLTSGTFEIGKRYKIDAYVAGDDFVNVGGTNASGTVFVATGTTPTTWTNSSSLRKVGATLALLPEGMQPSPGQCLDAANGNHAIQPASGSSLLRPKYDWRFSYQFSFLNGLAVYAYGNRAVLPANAWITRIIVTVSGSNIQDFGIGTTANHSYYAQTSGITAGSFELEILNQPDGSFELLIDPSDTPQMDVELLLEGTTK